MVRKWSYLTTNNTSATFHKMTSLLKCYSFKVFRKTTRFKKFKRLETVFVRKKDSTRKRQTSWFTLTVILAQWSLQYLKSRQHLRYFQTIDLHYYRFQISNIYVLTKKLPLLNGQIAFTTMGISKKFNNHFSQKILFNNINPLLLREANVNNLVYDNHSFSSANFSHIHTHFDWTLLTSTVFTWHLLYGVELYKILILLTLKNQ